jgi:hypothetical protein
VFGLRVEFQVSNATLEIQSHTISVGLGEGPRRWRKDDQRRLGRPAHQNTDDLRAQFDSPAQGQLDARAVNTAVNNVRNDGPHLLDPAPGNGG